MIPSLVGGGAERVAVTVLSALDPARYERVLYLFSNEGVYFDRIAPGVQIVIASRRSWPARLWELAAFLRSARPQIVMPFLSYFITAAAAWLAGGQSRVVFNQGTPTTGFLADPDFAWRQPWRRRVFAVLTRLFYNRADAIVVTSTGVADDLVSRYRVARTRIRVLHNPVDLESIERSAAESNEGGALDATRPVIVAAGRLARVKNYPLLIEAIARLDEPEGSSPRQASSSPHRARGVRAWILGDGPERERLEHLAVELGVSDRVRLWGFQQNPWRFIAKADVFVLTSAYEGFGNVLIEAMACGTPVVATRSPGTVEIIEHGVNGLLVDHEPQAVATAIAQLLSDRSLRDRIVQQARRDVQRYALPRVAERYDLMFRELVA